MEFRILGPLEVVVDGRPVQLAGAREREVLTVLLLDANRPVTVNRLIDSLWGDDPPETARKSLQVRIAGLRKALGRDRIASHGSGYAVRVQPSELDLVRFERLVARADREPPEVAVSLLGDALDLWRGAPLVEFADREFAASVIARLDELRLVALEKRIDAELELGRHREVVPELERLLVEHPLREAPVRQLMVALYRSGRQADALAAYRRWRAFLSDELALEPTPALQALERAILVQDERLDAVEFRRARSILVAELASPTDGFDALRLLVEPLARHSGHEVVVAQLIGNSSDLHEASAVAGERRRSLHEAGVAARSAAFTTQRPAADLVRIVNEQDVDLLLLEAPPLVVDDPVVRQLLLAAPCDVGLHAAHTRPDAWGGPILVPFTGGTHDWSAIEIGAWLSRGGGGDLLLAGPIEETRDASRLLAQASLAVQRALGVRADPLLLDPGAEALLSAARDAALVVVGLTERWQVDGLGQVRASLVGEAEASVLLVHGGLRPSALAPAEARTLFTWSVAVR